MRKAGRPMPSAASSHSPPSAKAISTPVAMATPRSAMRRRSDAEASAVRAAKSGAVPIGSMTTTKMTNVAMIVSLMARGPG